MVVEDDVVKVCKHQQMQFFEIYEPNYSRKTVMLKCDKVGQFNKVKFLKAPSMGEQHYYVSGAVVKKAPKRSNGSIMCYDVKLSELTPIEYTQGCAHML